MTTNWLPTGADKDIAMDNTVANKDRSRPLPPGPPDADDIDFRESEGMEKGSTSTPGAGPNPTLPDVDDGHSPAAPEGLRHPRH